MNCLVLQQKEAINQEMWMAPRSWEKYGKGFSSKASRKEHNFGGILNFTLVELLTYRISIEIYVVLSQNKV